MKHKKWLIVCLCVFLLFPLSVFGATFDTIVVFGDSLSDNGNIYALTGNTSPDPTEYYQGRFSNGEVWVEYLADTGFFDCTLVDKAQGGAETGAGTFPPNDGLNTQVTEYITDNPIVPDNVLFVIWIGANDMFTITDPADAPVVIATAVTNIQTALESLATYGVECILILNLPDLGSTPLYYGTAGAANATLISQSFNTSLAQVVSTFESANPGITVYEMDIFDMFEDIVDDPSHYGFTNVTDALKDDPFYVGPWDNPDGYVFWDDIHPTTEAHEVIAEEAYDMLNPETDSDDDDNGCFIGSLLSMN